MSLTPFIQYENEDFLKLLIVRYIFIRITLSLLHPLQIINLETECISSDCPCCKIWLYFNYNYYMHINFIATWVFFIEIIGIVLKSMEAKNRISKNPE